MSTQHRHIRLVFPPRAEQVSISRRAIVQTLRSWGVEDFRDTPRAVGLIASELLTNVVRYAPAAPVETSLLLELVNGDWIRLGVHDGHPCCPTPVESGDECTSGRGLKIVHALVAELDGVIFTERTDDGGKTIWVELPCLIGGHATEPQRHLVGESAAGTTVRTPHAALEREDLNDGLAA
ncbi:ATP-binding protein [Streptomyces sioyaensis]|uniref:ATP-binding protein n=1 Tax=Streptomyces sioyaensis TaxID=67364 RepID=UPI003650E5DA